MGKAKSHSNFFSPSTPSSPTPTSNSGEVRVPSWGEGALLTTGIRRRAGGGRRGRARAAPELRRSPSVPAPGVAVGLGGVEREKVEVEDEGR